ncbi:MAG: heme exporter protein CcmD [Coriobacteriales bacterium]|jgi:heme exporter protein CcmD|nr:heme exporter protein CcmD [Coriobacteriales bacterium]
MDPILAEIYSTVFQAAPYVIGAYVLMWLVLAVFVVISVNGLKRTEKQLAALEEAVNELAGKQQ